MIKPFEFKHRGSESSDSEEGDFDVSAQKLLFNFRNLLLAFWWSNDHPKNYKEWFLQVIN